MVEKLEGLRKYEGILIDKANQFIVSNIDAKESLLDISTINISKVVSMTTMLKNTKLSVKLTDHPLTLENDKIEDDGAVLTCIKKQKPVLMLMT
ncbi:MAG: hypothetical protein IPO92_19320 [Saprospiraceae bacterium]|nr:hypothetical protein [Saprospiraceae bacterium]